MSFKIIAIRPLKDCNPKFLKNLKINNVYHFYNNYTFKFKDENEFDEVIGISCNPNGLEHLYELGKLKVNISAVAGKNGSGKSTIMELLICAINNISHDYGFKLNNHIVGSKFGLEKIQDIKLEFYFELNGIFKVVIDRDIKFYEVGRNDLFKTKSRDFKYYIKNNFFYTQVINYSLHSYNSLEIGKWIFRLFHKNDGYQIPVVLNPYREQTGTININREKELAEDRLLATLLIPTDNKYEGSRKLTDVLFATKLKITLKKVEDYERREIYGIVENGILKERVYLHQYIQKNSQQAIRIFKYFLPEEYIESKNKNIQLIKFYILVKIIKIANVYPDFDDVFDKKNNCFYKDKLRKFLNDLNKDSSHITYKIKRLLNFIKHKDQLGIDFTTKVLDIHKYSSSINKLSTNVIEFLPPPIFETEIILQLEDDKKEIEFEDLSSGEKQLIYSVNTLVYHINNIDSVIKRRSKIKYKAVNIILDEIELYFHPEFQRKFINRVIENFARLKLNTLDAINIICVTHSPFILSDIPNSNIMFLEVDKLEKFVIQRKNKRQTFAANIHELLSDGFFMEYTKGDFAISKINEILNFYSEVKETNQEDIAFRDLRDLYLTKREGFISIIEIVGEEYIKKVLQNHLFFLEEKFELDRYLKIKQQQLLAELEVVNKQLER